MSFGLPPRLEKLFHGILLLGFIFAGVLMVMLLSNRPARATDGQNSLVVLPPSLIPPAALYPTPIILTPTASPVSKIFPLYQAPTIDPLDPNLTRCAPNAVFAMPTQGVIAYLWDDSFYPGHRHTGLDIFGGTGVGLTPVVAAYPGYLTRERGWVAALIIRIPSDPLMPGRQIWTYYTHLADRYGNSFISSEFPPGTTEVYVKAGTLLGYQGNYTGDAASPAGVHLHFSIVLSSASGKYMNELEIKNTLDPSPYFGIPLNGRTAPYEQVICENGNQGT